MRPSIPWATEAPRFPQASAPQRDGTDFVELFALLWGYRRDDDQETFRMARVMAAACAGERHLWEDMGLPDRDALSRLIRRHFPVLFHKNKGDMRWKKFFYKQVCEGAQARVCKAPNCGACADYAACFGPE